MQHGPLLHQPHHPVVVCTPAFENRAAVERYIAEHRERIDQLIWQHAGVLLRGTGVLDSQALAHVVAAFGSNAHQYVGGNSPRTHLGSAVYTSTEYPSSEEISLHNEMSYLPAWPSRLYFNCSVAPQRGGQTTLAHTVDVLQQMPADIVAAFKNRRLRYSRTLQPTDFMGKGWKTTYGTADPGKVEAIVSGQGSACTWLPRQVLRVVTVCDATAIHPVTGQEVWFNQAEQWHPSALAPQTRALIGEAFGADGYPHDCRFADGEVIGDDMMRRVREVLHANELLFDWQAGDVLVIDNLLAMHGRKPFEGPRRIQTYLAA